MASKQTSPGFVLWHGIVGGVISGITLMVFQMTAAAAQEGSAFIAPRLLASLVFGEDALFATFPLPPALVVGMVLHLMISVAFGVLFVYLLTVFRRVCTSWRMLLAYGLAFGFALWAVNYRVLGSILFPQLLSVDQFWLGFIAHTFFFGMTLGAYLAIVRYGRVGTMILGYQACRI
jgi:uncharacterized membrane protein YagU involved in acid resistance